MDRRRRLTLIVSALLIGLSFLPATARGPQVSQQQPASQAQIVPGIMPLHVRGTAKNELTSPPNFVYTADVYSLASGEYLGVAVNKLTCSTSPPPCLVADLVTTYRLPLGDIVSRVRVSVVPDPQRSGFALTGARPGADTIVSGTEAFEGRTGRVRISGLDDLTQFPMEVTFDSFHVIEIN